MGGDTEVSYELSPRGKDVLLTIGHRRLQPRPFWTTHTKLEQQYSALVP